MKQKESIIQFALSHYGLKEIPGPDHTKRILNMFRYIGFENIKDDETPWCTAFVLYCLKKYGVSIPNTLKARDLAKIGNAIDPSAATVCGHNFVDIPVFWRGHKHAETGHVGFFISYVKESINILGGNQSNQVNIKSYGKSKLISMRRVYLSA